MCPEKKPMILVILLFLRKGNGLAAKMEVIGLTRRTKEEIEIHEVLFVIQQRDNFNFITFD